MKKGLMILGVGLVCALVASAGTLVVPLVQDNGADSTGPGNTPTAAAETATFIGITNGTGVAMTVTTAYTDYAGADVTPASNTFVVGVGVTNSLRPAASDANESAASAAVNAVSPLAGVVGTTFTWTGATDGVTCRVAALNGTATYAYSVQPF